MKEKVGYTIIELKDEREKKDLCSYCPWPEKNNVSFLLNGRNNETLALVMRGFFCSGCLERFNKKELKTCPCGRVFKRNEDNCLCDFLKDRYGEDGLPSEHQHEDYSIQLEREIEKLGNEKEWLETQVEATAEIHFEAIKAAEKWGSRQELIAQNEELATKSRRLSNENKELRKQVEELAGQLLGVDEITKKARRLSDENRKLKGKIEGLELEIKRHKGATFGLKPNISQLKTDVLELEVKLEKMILGELETHQEIPPK